MVRSNPADHDSRDRFADCETVLASLLLRTGRAPESRAACDRAIEIREALVKDHPEIDHYPVGLASSLYHRGRARQVAGDARGAAEDYRRAVGILASRPSPSDDVRVLEALGRAAIAGLAGEAGSSVPASEGPAESGLAMGLIREAVSNGHRDPSLADDPALDPLRPHPDFRSLMLDLAFLRWPFSPRTADLSRTGSGVASPDH